MKLRLRPLTSLFPQGAKRDKRRNPRESGQVSHPSNPLKTIHNTLPKETAVYILPSLLLYSSSYPLPRTNTHTHSLTHSSHPPPKFASPRVKKTVEIHRVIMPFIENQTTTAEPIVPVDVKGKDAFHKLVDDLSAVLGPSSGLDSDDVDPMDIQKLMEGYVSNHEEWQRYALADESRAYTRNLVDEGNGKSNLVSRKVASQHR